MSSKILPGRPQAGPRLSCEGCGQPLPLRSSGWGESLTRWVCVACGSGSLAVYDEQCTKDEMSRILLAEVYFDTSKSPRITLAHKNRIERLIENTADGPKAEKRCEPRVRRSLPVVCVRVDKGITPVGPAFHAVMFDISTGGMGMATIQPEPSGSMVVKIPTAGGHAIQVLFSVIHCTELESSVYRVGGSLLGRFGECRA